MSARSLFAGRAWRRGGLFLFVAFAAVVLARADTTHDIAMVPGADADIRLTTPGNVAFRRGFAPLRVRIANRGPRDRTWQLEVFDHGGYPGMRTTETLTTTFSLSVNGGETREFVVFAPIGAWGMIHGGSLSGRVRGPEVQSENFSLLLSWGGLSCLPIATETALAKAFEMAEIPPATTRTGRRITRPPGRTRPLAEVSAFDPAAWPADWRMWSAFAVVALRQETWQQLDEARRRALRDWVAMGGRLLLVPAQRKPGGVERHGGGEIATLSAPLPRPVDEASAQQLYENHHGSTADWLASNAHWTRPPVSVAQPQRTGWLTFFVIAFGALIGPVNLFVFAPAGRRHRLFWTVPAISIGAAAVLFGAIMLGDGWGGTGWRRALVVLLPEENQAAVVQWQISRAGLLGSREFALPADVLANWDNAGEPTNGQRRLLRKDDTASGDWFVSRGAQVHTFRRLVPTRERVELTREADGTLVAQSTASAVLRDLVYCDEEARYWTASEVPPGQRVKLRSIDATAKPAVLAKHAPSTWSPGAFYALADKSAIGLLPTLSSIRWREDIVIYTGQLTVKEAKP